MPCRYLCTKGSHASRCHPPLADQAIEAVAISWGRCPGDPSRREALQVRHAVTAAAHALAPAKAKSFVKHLEKGDGWNVGSGLIDSEPDPLRTGVMQFKPPTQFGGRLERHDREIRRGLHASEIKGPPSLR